MAAVARAHRFTRSRRWFRRQGVAEIRTAAGLSRAGHRQAGQAGADAGGDIPGRAAHFRSGPCPHRLRSIGPHHVSTSRCGLPDWGLCGHRCERRQQSQLHGVRTLQDAARARRRSRAAVAHDTEHRISRVRHAASIVGRRIATRRSGASARLGSAGSPTAEPAGKGRSVHSRRHGSGWGMADRGATGG